MWINSLKIRYFFLGEPICQPTNPHKGRVGWDTQPVLMFKKATHVFAIDEDVIKENKSELP